MSGSPRKRPWAQDEIHSQTVEDTGTPMKKAKVENEASSSGNMKDTTVTKGGTAEEREGGEPLMKSVNVAPVDRSSLFTSGGEQKEGQFFTTADISTLSPSHDKQKQTSSFITTDTSTLSPCRGSQGHASAVSSSWGYPPSTKIGLTLPNIRGTSYRPRSLEPPHPLLAFAPLPGEHRLVVAERDNLRSQVQAQDQELRNVRLQLQRHEYGLLRRDGAILQRNNEILALKAEIRHLRSVISQASLSSQSAPPATDNTLDESIESYITTTHLTCDNSKTSSNSPDRS